MREKVSKIAHEYACLLYTSAGVNINASSSGVGGATRVVMRGTKSISSDNNALYVIEMCIRDSSIITFIQTNFVKVVSTRE